MTAATDYQTRSNRYFGSCMNTACKYRNVRDMNQSQRAYANNEHCPDCGVIMRYRQLEGKYNPAKECGSRCMASRGPSCSCSCGGENHGSNHL